MRDLFLPPGDSTLIPSQWVWSSMVLRLTNWNKMAAAHHQDTSGLKAAVCSQSSPQHPFKAPEWPFGSSARLAV
ncbi:hypothetical protein SKAU_G00158630 [Synaphobranchus kaupii]|uniref:Uncharacterized protein n=1 Tax=Synaphobranchus kaupii TaxID=118154 RepID=A0A9Q1FI87_SYNKA|nr:hypothetical protein SKAU_G00158630 [Synaphobranchus kaupii]